MAEARPRSSDVDLADAARYRHWKDHVLRFADLDPAGHVNNVAYAEIFEAGRVAFGMDAGSRKLAPGTTTMVVRMTIDYLAQLHFPGAVRVGTRVLSFGRSSCLLGQALFADGRCVATSDAVSVLVDLETNRSTPMPDALRASYRDLSDG